MKYVYVAMMAISGIMSALSPVAPTPRGRTCHVDADCYPGEVCVQSGGERQCVRREGPR